MTLRFLGVVMLLIAAGAALEALPLLAFLLTAESGGKKSEMALVFGWILCWAVLVVFGFSLVRKGDRVDRMLLAWLAAAAVVAAGLAFFSGSSRGLDPSMNFIPAAVAIMLAAGAILLRQLRGGGR